MPNKAPSLMARCLECDSRIYFDRKPDLGQIIVCPECETSLEVVRTNPIQFGWADEGSERDGSAGGVNLDEFFNNLRNNDTEDEDYDDDYRD